MAKLNLCKLVDTTTLQHEREPVTSLVGGKYDALWKNVEKAIRMQTVKNAHATQSCLYTLITSD